MKTLASFHRTLAPIVGHSEAALYERQKALVRVGVLPKATGRGWNSGGAKATPENVSWLLLSVLATDNLFEVPVLTPSLGRNRAVTRDEDSPFPDEISFHSAVSMTLQYPTIARRVTNILVQRRVGIGAIWWMRGRPPEITAHSTAFEDATHTEQSSGLLISATLLGECLQELSANLAEGGST